MPQHDDTAPATREGAPERGDLLVRSLHMRAVRLDKREVDFIASTAAVDSYDEIVEQSWRLERFNANPVILWAHNSRELPIGQALNTKVVDGKLVTTVRFASEKANPRAEQVWQGIQEGTIRAVSVGFMPHSYRWEKQDDVERLILSDNELLEISVTPVPANPEALAKLRAKAIAAHERGVAQASKDRDAQPMLRAVNGDESGTYTLGSGVESLTLSSSPMILAQDLRASLDAIEKAVSAMTNKQAQPADARGTQQETAMSAPVTTPTSTPANDSPTEKAMEDKLIAAKAQVSTLEKQVADLEAKCTKTEQERTALAAQNEHLVKERDALKERADQLDGQLIDLEVTKLVGAKITPAEKDLFVQLRKADKSLFDSMIAQRGALPHTQQSIPSEGNTKPTAEKNVAEDIHAKALKAAEADED